jgi:hypothetical protein
MQLMARARSNQNLLKMQAERFGFSTSDALKGRRSPCRTPCKAPMSFACARNHPCAEPCYRYRFYMVIGMSCRADVAIWQTLYDFIAQRRGFL